MLDVDAIDQDAALLWIVETREQREQRGFAAAIAADDRDAPAFGNNQINIPQRRRCGVRISKSEIFEANLALKRGEFFSDGRI